MNKRSHKNIIATRLAELRHSLSYIDALPQLTILGLIVGLMTGLIIVGFRWLIDLPLSMLLPVHSENFEAISSTTRIIFIGSGIVLLIALLSFFSRKDSEVSVSHVLDRTHNYQGKLPFKNWAIQFIGAVVALGSGQSVGREGPVVHLGAGAASLFGQWLRLPNNSIHTLVGCGVAAAISSSFDTPMAGVIFAMEILALEYTIVGFVPIILSSVTGTVISKALLGDGGFLTIGDANIHSLHEIPLMIVVGLVIAICAGIYIRLNIFALKFTHYPLALRLLIAGGATCAVVIWVPQIMGQGYDTVNHAVEGTAILSTLALVALAKLILTPVVIGLGIPGGLIGPLLVIGACVGGALGLFVSQLFPELGAHPHFYVMMGMAGMMAAVLNAPLTALVTVLELSYNPNILFPAMLVVVIACITTRQIFNVQGIFVEQLLHSGRSLDFGPAKQALKRAGVRSVMDTRFVITEHLMNVATCRSILVNHPMWLILLDENRRYSHAMRAADLANHIDSLTTPTSDDNETLDDSTIENIIEDSTEIDLQTIPSRKFRISAIHESASLYEAMLGFNQEGTELLYISGTRTSLSGEIKGILTFSAIENYYKPVEFKNAVD
ncbi:MAG: chloride channel protein [Agarilytica sp.]